MNAQPSFWEDQRLDIAGSLRLTAESIASYAGSHRHWGLAYSGGKDSTALLAAVCYLLERDLIPRPQSLTVMYADTRMELPPLHSAAMTMLQAVTDRGFETRIVLPPIDKRFMVYMLGRGVPPPNNNTLRWCTRQIKVDPMAAELRSLRGQAGGSLLMLTGVRLGESAVRDARIALSCSRDGGECGQGWYQRDLAGDGVATLAPILHWRVCTVWDWLMEAFSKASDFRHGLPTHLVAEAYDADAEGSPGEINARTGCTGCPLATQDSAMDRLLRHERWQWLAPLKGLRPLYRWLREPAQRLRKPGGETRRDGTLVANQYRMGPLTMSARRQAFAAIESIQNQCRDLAGNAAAVDLINVIEAVRIQELWDANTWPNRWTGHEPIADQPFDEAGQLSFLNVGGKGIA